MDTLIPLDIPYAKQKGFTLLEVIVVMVILGLLLGGLLIPLSVQIEVKNVQKTQNVLNQVKAALIGYSILHPNSSLPCPATSADTGVADISSGLCTVSEGYVPWANLGLDNIKDAWGRPLRYRVDSAFSNTSFPSDAAASTADGLSLGEMDGTVLVSGTNSPIVAILFSCGKNGVPNGENDDDGAKNTSNSCTNDDSLVDTTYTSDLFNDTPDNFSTHYDDTLIWLSKYTLINKLVTAQKWTTP